MDFQLVAVSGNRSGIFIALFGVLLLITTFRTRRSVVVGFLGGLLSAALIVGGILILTTGKL